MKSDDNSSAKLLYSLDFDDGHGRRCVISSMEQAVSALTYDDQNHQIIEHCHDRKATSIAFITFGIARGARRDQTQRHEFLGRFQPFRIPVPSYFAFTMDWAAAAVPSPLVKAVTATNV